MQAERSSGSRGVALLGLLAAGCAGVTPPPTVEDFEQAYVLALCESFLACPTPGSSSSEPDAFQTQLGDVDGCVAWSAGVTGVGQPKAPAWADAVRAGLADYDPAAAAACLEWVRSTCVYDYSFLDSLDPCADAIVGRGEAGAPCEESFHCARGTYCTRSPGDLCGGTCAPVEPGGACGSTAECGDPGQRYCRADPLGGPVGRCLQATPRVVGLGSYCGGGAFCERGLSCRYSGSSFPVLPECAAPVGVGAPCASGDACVAGSLCLEQVDGSRRCTIPSLAHEVSGACDDTSHVSCAWLDGLDCVGGSCARLVDGAEGAPCSRAVPNTCGPGLSCLRDSVDAATCVRPGAEGAPCSSRWYCEPGLDCVAGACAPPSCGP